MGTTISFLGYVVFALPDAATLSVTLETAPMTESKSAGTSMPVPAANSSSVFLNSSRLSSNNK